MIALSLQWTVSVLLSEESYSISSESPIPPLIPTSGYEIESAPLGRFTPAFELPRIYGAVTVFIYLLISVYISGKVPPCVP